ncbi:allophanate hydrolase subunit 1 [Streptomyces sp. NPDC002588]|uniref:5-oxoprolinase subunit B family protein n=1 Tax=Streptomyces sp. NPDC002588 TaxID=3154419 RepID=UPI003331289F
MRVMPFGEDALLVEVASGSEAEALHAELLRRRAAGLLRVREIVPAARTVLLDGVDDPARLMSELAAADIPSAPARSGEVIELRVRYDGPDLADVAAHWGVTEEEAARIHAGTEFRVAFCGFAPGFGYLTGLPPRYDVPRRATPRTRVPAGSVALAGPYTGVYPRSSPGGWQLIGSTDAVLWDHARVPAALLSPGTRVRFVAVGPASPAEPAAEPPKPPAEPAGAS